MNRLLITIISLIFSSGAIAQSVNVGKSDQVVTGAVEISAQAIPLSEAGSVVIDPAVYHKIESTGVQREPTSQIVQSSASVLPATQPHQDAVHKESVETGVIFQEKATVIKVESVQPVEPKK